MVRKRRPNTLETLTIGQVAEICCVSSHVVTEWCNQGLIHYHRLPSGMHHRRIRRRDLLAFADAYGMDHVVEALRNGKGSDG